MRFKHFTSISSTVSNIETIVMFWSITALWHGSSDSFHEPGGWILCYNMCHLLNAASQNTGDLLYLSLVNSKLLNGIHTAGSTQLPTHLLRVLLCLLMTNYEAVAYACFLRDGSTKLLRNKTCTQIAAGPFPATIRQGWMLTMQS